jgi:hypothetical protein
MGLLSNRLPLGMSPQYLRAASRDKKPFDLSEDWAQLPDDSYNINSMSQQIEDDAMPTQMGEIEKLGMAAPGVPNEPYNTEFDEKTAQAGLAMMDAATPDQPDYMQVRRGPRYQRQTPYKYKGYGEY